MRPIECVLLKLPLMGRNVGYDILLSQWLVLFRVEAAEE